MVHAACNTGSGQLAVRSSAHALTSQCARHSGSRWAVLENVWFSASAFPVQKCPGCSVYPPAASARSTTAARKLPKLMARCLRARILASWWWWVQKHVFAASQLASCSVVPLRRRTYLAAGTLRQSVQAMSWLLSVTALGKLVVSSCCREACAACVPGACTYMMPVCVCTRRSSRCGQNYDSADHFNFQHDGPSRRARCDHRPCQRPDQDLHISASLGRCVCCCKSITSAAPLECVAASVHAHT
jgi:hypothetical protein